MKLSFYADSQLFIDTKKVVKYTARCYVLYTFCCFKISNCKRLKTYKIIFKKNKIKTFQIEKKKF